MTQQISTTEFVKEKNEEDILLDVRSPGEFQIANIGGVLIPLDQLDIRFSELPKDKKIFVLCHHGSRSQMACSFLESHGYANVYNIVGGIDAYSTQVDSKIPRY